MKWPLAVAIVVAVLLLAVVTGLASGTPQRIKLIASCPGSERWSIKTLTDPVVGSVDFAHPVTTMTVVQLAAQNPAPLHIGSSTPRLPLEKVVYRVTVRLVKAKIDCGTSVARSTQSPCRLSGPC